MCEYISMTIITEDANMKKYVYDKNNGLWYELQGDYYIPCLTLPAEEEKPIGILGNDTCGISDRTTASSPASPSWIRPWSRRP